MGRSRRISLLNGRGRKALFLSLKGTVQSLIHKPGSGLVPQIDKERGRSPCHALLPAT